jgi:hypothetical protein
MVGPDDGFRYIVDEAYLEGLNDGRSVTLSPYDVDVWARGVVHEHCYQVKYGVN